MMNMGYEPQSSPRHTRLVEEMDDVKSRIARLQTSNAKLKRDIAAIKGKLELADTKIKDLEYTLYPEL